MSKDPSPGSLVAASNVTERHGDQGVLEVRLLHRTDSNYCTLILISLSQDSNLSTNEQVQMAPDTFTMPSTSNGVGGNILLQTLEQSDFVDQFGSNSSLTQWNEHDFSPILDHPNSTLNEINAVS